MIHRGNMSSAQIASMALENHFPSLTWDNPVEVVLFSEIQNEEDYEIMDPTAFRNDSDPDGSGDEIGVVFDVSTKNLLEQA